MAKRRGDVTHVIREHWDARAPTFDDDEEHGLFSEEQRRAWLELLASTVGAAPLRVLDVGCGTGFLALRLAELGHSVTGVDLAERMLERARAKAEAADLSVDFRSGDAAALELGDETYDVVVARHVIWNLPDPRQGVAEWVRVLRPGGSLLLVEGKWAENDALARSYSRPLARLVALIADAAARSRLPLRGLESRLLARRYRKVEATLPFSGGPSAERLMSFLRASGLEDVAATPLMDPVLWGDEPRFSRYLVRATRARSA